MSDETENENLRKALAKCLESIHDYFGVTEDVMRVAVDDAAKNPDWSPFDEDRWTETAYPETRKRPVNNPTK